MEDGGGSCVGVGREDVVEEVGGSNKHIDSAGGSEVALDVDVGIGGVGNNNDKQSQQHVTAHTTHNTYTYPRSILRNTHNTHTQSKSKVGGTADNDEQIIEYLQSGVRHFVKSTPDDAPPTRKPLRGEQEGCGSPTSDGGLRAVDHPRTCRWGKSVGDLGDNISCGVGNGGSVGDGGLIVGGVEEEVVDVEVVQLGSVGSGLGSVGHGNLIDGSVC